MIFEEIINNKYKIVSQIQLLKKDREKIKILLDKKNMLEKNINFYNSLKKSTKKLEIEIKKNNSEISELLNNYEDIFINDI